jgi:hypothetical protein
MRVRRQTRSHLVADLTALRVPLAVARAEAVRVTLLAQAVAAGRMSLTEARSQLRGET